MGWVERPTPGGWQFRNDTTGATIIVEQITPIGRGVEAWVELRIDDDPIPLSQGTRNLMVPRAPQPFLDDVRGREEGWEAGVRFAFHHTLQAWREESVTLDLATVEPVPLQWLVEPLVEQGGNTRLIAAGGSGKSVFALALALTVATGSPKWMGLSSHVTGPVLYLDWETSAETHARRLMALCAGAEMTYPISRDLVLYRNETAPLSQTVRRVKDAADRGGVIMVIVDSRQMAAGSSGMSSGEDTAQGLYGALRAIGKPALILDHKSKEDIAKGRRGGYGSVFNQNLARMEWEMTRLIEPQPGVKRFVLSLEKENNVGRIPPVAFELVTKGSKEGIEFARFHPTGVQALIEASEDDLADRILSLFVVSSEPMRVDRIADMLEAKQSSVRATLNKDGRFFNVNEGRKGSPGLWRPADEFLPSGRDDGVQPDLLGGEVF